jgi:hypothetical protein
VVPAETTIRRTLAWVDPEALAAVIGAWLVDRDRPGQRRRAVAVDDKTLRGARCDGRQVHLLAAMDHTTRAVLALADDPAGRPGSSGGQRLDRNDGWSCWDRPGTVEFGAEESP